MRTTCLINSYNYRSFVTEAVDSALSQSLPVDQIVIVDDGSTDGSSELLHDRYGSHPRVEIISKHNAGQLSCFQTGVERATGDVVFFLDADDVWEPTYVQTTIESYRSNPESDFVFCGLQRFGEEDGIEMPWTHDRDLGYSLALTSLRRRWQGAPTSALSMRRWVLDRIFPVPFLEDWRIRADDCLVYGADLAGARRRYLARLLVRYRVHDRNHFMGRTWSASSKYRRKLALGRFFKMMHDRMGWDVRQLPELAHLEFETIGDPTRKEFRRYSALVLRADRPIQTRLGRLIRMLVLTLRRASGDTERSRQRQTERFGLELAAIRPQEHVDVPPRCSR